MARDWREAPMETLERRLMSLAPDNAAPIPIAAHKEESELEPGHWIWIVSVTVRIPGVTEYDVEGFGDTVWEAARRAYLGLNNEPRLRKQADISNKQFGVLLSGIAGLLLNSGALPF